MSERLMSDARHSELLKAAESVIELMNVGVNPNSAMFKVAEDKDMNDHEIDLVSHAINNSKQLAHLQGSEPADKEKPFPMIDPEGVRAIREQPETNADRNTGDRYAVQETPSDSAVQKADGRDAVETKEEMDKAAADSYAAGPDLRKRAEKPDYAALLRSGWDLDETKVAESQLADNVIDNPYRKLSFYRIGLEEASVRYQEAKTACEAVLDGLVHELRRVDAPKFADIEKTAAILGASKDTMDLIYDRAALAKFSEQRYDWSTKTASDRIYVSPRISKLAADCVRADTFWKAAADALAARGIIESEQKAAMDKVAEESAGWSGSVKVDPATIGQSMGKLPEDYFASEETVTEALGRPGEAKPLGLMDIVPQESRQEAKNTETRAAIEGLMQDEYIGGHDLPEVIEAYNSALSVNPNFGRAQLISYIRQHLATQGAVPLDLQLRASSTKTRTPDEED